MTGPVGQPSVSLWRFLWDGWSAYAHRAGGYQAQVLLSLVYFVVLGPTAIVSRLTGNRLLDIDPRKRDSYWIARKDEPTTLAVLERQF